MKSQREAEETETALLAEFASERSSWSDKEALLSPASMRLKTSLMVSLFIFFLRVADLDRADSWF